MVAELLRATDGTADEVALLRSIIECQRLVHTRSRDLDAVMAIIVDQAQSLTGASGAVVELRDGDDMVYRAGSGDAAEHVGLRLALDGSLSGLTVTSREPAICLDTETDERVDREACRRIGVRSMIVVPLIADDADCVGVLKVTSEDPAAFGATDMATLEIVAEFLGTSIQHAADFQANAYNASHDALTGLLSRASFLERLDIALRRLAGQSPGVAVLYLDLDGFKAVNDTYGHTNGDSLLAAISERVVTCLRDEDAVGRLGGDEFAVLCSGVPDDVIVKIADRIKGAVAVAFPLAGVTLHPRVSVGIAFGETGDTPETIVERADAAMYAVKRRPTQS